MMLEKLGHKVQKTVGSAGLEFSIQVRVDRWAHLSRLRSFLGFGLSELKLGVTLHYPDETDSARSPG